MPYWPWRAVERIDDAAEADARVIDLLAALGLDPSAPRESTHFVYVPLRDGADAVAAALHGDGWLASVEADEDASWLVTASRLGALTPTIVRETRARFEALASEHGGVYDGWEAKTG